MKQVTSPNYKWNAQDYAKNSQNQFQWAQELIPKLQLKGNETLLDIGCGDGKITAELAKYLPKGKAVGIDSSRNMINLAEKNFSAKDYPNLSFQVMDARKLTFQDEFDRAFSNAALHWVLDQISVLKGIQRSLKSGGKLLFQMAGKGNAKDIIGKIEQLMPLDSWNQYFLGMAFPYGFYDAEEYRAFLESAGLIADRIELFPKVMKLQDAEGLAGWVRTTWLPFTDKLPEALKSKFVSEIVDRYLKDHPVDANSVVNVGMIRIEVQAHKK